jgi:GntR family transcriptional regulator of arabinose operon
MSDVIFDNSEQAASAEVPLTTMNHPKHKVGVWAAEILFDHIETGAQSNPRKILITSIVVERSSVKFLNGTGMNNLVS